jgi:hypothetical protein
MIAMSVSFGQVTFGKRKTLNDDGAWNVMALPVESTMRFIFKSVTTMRKSNALSTKKFPGPVVVGSSHTTTRNYVGRERDRMNILFKNVAQAVGKS